MRLFSLSKKKRKVNINIVSKKIKLTRVDSFNVVSLPSSNPRNNSIRFDNFLINNFKFDFRLFTVKSYKYRKTNKMKI
jgi:hypothetical protein